MSLFLEPLNGAESAYVYRGLGPEGKDDLAFARWFAESGFDVYHLSPRSTGLRHLSAYVRDRSYLGPVAD